MDVPQISLFLLPEFRAASRNNPEALDAVISGWLENVKRDHPKSMYRALSDAFSVYAVRGNRPKAYALLEEIKLLEPTNGSIECSIARFLYYPFNDAEAALEQLERAHKSLKKCKSVPEKFSILRTCNHLELAIRAEQDPHSDEVRRLLFLELDLARNAIGETDNLIKAMRILVPLGIAGLESKTTLETAWATAWRTERFCSGHNSKEIQEIEGLISILKTDEDSDED
jgi:hypothetical protein